MAFRKSLKIESLKGIMDFRRSQLIKIMLVVSQLLSTL